MPEAYRELAVIVREWTVWVAQVRMRIWCGAGRCSIVRVAAGGWTATTWPQSCSTMRCQHGRRSPGLRRLPGVGRSGRLCGAVRKLPGN